MKNNYFKHHKTKQKINLDEFIPVFRKAYCKFIEYNFKLYNHHLPKTFNCKKLLLLFKNNVLFEYRINQKKNQLTDSKRVLIQSANNKYLDNDILKFDYNYRIFMN